MALFLKQNEQRSHLQEKIAADLTNRTKTAGSGANPNIGSEIAEESQAATGRSIFWVGVVTMSVIALVVFVIVIFNA